MLCVVGWKAFIQTIPYGVGGVDFNQLLVGLGKWTSRGEDAVSNGVVGCVVVGGIVLFFVY